MWRPGLTRPMVRSVTLSLLATGSIEMILLSRYRWRYPGSAWMAAGFFALAPVSLTLTWTVRAWITSPLAGVMMVSLAALPGREEVEGPGGPLAAWPLPPDAAEMRRLPVRRLAAPGHCLAGFWRTSTGQRWGRRSAITGSPGRSPKP